MQRLQSLITYNRPLFLCYFTVALETQMSSYIFLFNGHWNTISSITKKYLWFRPCVINKCCTRFSRQICTTISSSTVSQKRFCWEVEPHYLHQVGIFGLDAQFLNPREHLTHEWKKTLLRFSSLIKTALIKKWTFMVTTLNLSLTQHRLNKRSWNFVIQKLSECQTCWVGELKRHHQITGAGKCLLHSNSQFGKIWCSRRSTIM